MLIGAANWFQVDPRQVQRDGLVKQLDFFSDCDLKGQQEIPAIKQRIAENRTATGGGSEPPGGSGGKSSGADVGTMMAARCNTQQRPYKWLLLWTGADVGLTFLLLLWMIYRAPTGLLNLLSIQCAKVLVLVVLAIYAGMQLQSQTKDLVDCQGYDEPARAEVEQLGFTCYSTANRPTSLKSVDHWATIFWVGTGFAMGGLGLLMLLVPIMHWAKIRIARQDGIDPEEGVYGDSRYGAAADHGTGRYDRDHVRTGADRSQWYNVGASDRDRDQRYGTGAGTGLGLGTGAAAAHRHRQGRGGVGWTHGDDRSARDIERDRESAYGAQRQPSVINRMTGGYFDREHGGGPETRSTWFGGDRDRERDYDRSGEHGTGRSVRDAERDRERGREAYGAQRQPSMLNRMTGGYFDGEHGGAPDSRHHRGHDTDTTWRDHGTIAGTGAGAATGRHLSEHEQAQQRGQYQPSFVDRVTGRDPNDPRGLVDRMTGRDPNDPRGLMDRITGRDEHRVGGSSAPYETSGSTTTYSHGGPTTSGLQTGHTGEHISTTTQRQPATAQWGQGDTGTTSRPIDQQRTTTTTTGSGAV